MNKCTECGSYAINHHCHGRDGSDPELCDVCYWRVRATDYAALEAECERLREALGYCSEVMKDPWKHGEGCISRAINRADAALAASTGQEVKP